MNNPLAEQQILECIVKYQCSDLFYSVAVDDFFDGTYGQIFGKLKEEYEKNGEFGLTTAMHILPDNHSKIIENIIRENKIESPSLRFKTVKVLKECRAIRLAKSFVPDKDIEALPQKYIDLGLELSNLLTTGKTDMEEIKQKILHPPPKVPTGFKNMDALLDGGIDEDGVFILAATPGTGKTYMACAIAANTISQNKTVHFTSLEMSDYKIVHRILKSAYQATGMEVRDRLEEMLNFNMEIQDRKSDCDSVLASMHENSEADLFIVDYLGLISMDSESNNVLELGKIARKIKQFSQLHKKPVVLLHQLNRDSVKSKREPELHDLRGSGHIEEHADIVTFLWNEDTANPEADTLKKIAEDFEGVKESSEKEILWLVKKNRNGKVGRIKVLLNPAIGYHE